MGGSLLNMKDFVQTEDELKNNLGGTKFEISEVLSKSGKH